MQTNWLKIKNRDYKLRLQTTRQHSAAYKHLDVCSPTHCMGQPTAGL
jgi:hypothetical protein